MHHTISYYMAQARIADLRHQAQRDALARALGVLRRTRAAPGTVRAMQPATAGGASAG